MRALVGNKSDLPRAVGREEAEALAESEQMEYFEVSAKTNANVEAVFCKLAREMKEKCKE